MARFAGIGRREARQARDRFLAVARQTSSPADHPDYGAMPEEDDDWCRNCGEYRGDTRLSEWTGELLCGACEAAAIERIAPEGVGYDPDPRSR